MMEFFGGQYDPRDLRDRVADISALIGVKPHTLVEGPERGVLAVDVWAGPLRFTVIPDRGMDVCRASFQGIPLDWVSGTGITSPYSYDPTGWRWLRSFHGGLVHTCGLNNVGEPWNDEDVSYGGHGEISNTPSRETAWGVEERHGVLTAFVRGKMRSVSPTEWDLSLTREVSCEIGGGSIIIEDSIANLGVNDTPVFLLYHCNIGFPLLSGDSILTIPAKEAVDGNDVPVPDFATLSEPLEAADDLVIHPLVESGVSEVEVGLRNPRLGNGGITLSLKYSAVTLPHLTIWKFQQKRSYVLAIEPGTCRVGGRDVETAQGREVILKSDASFKTRLEFAVREGGA